MDRHEIIIYWNQGNFRASGNPEQLHERDTLAERNFQPSIKSDCDKD